MLIRQKRIQDFQSKIKAQISRYKSKTDKKITPRSAQISLLIKKYNNKFSNLTDIVDNIITYDVFIEAGNNIVSNLTFLQSQAEELFSGNISPKLNNALEYCYHVSKADSDKTLFNLLKNLVKIPNNDIKASHETLVYFESEKINESDVKIHLPPLMNHCQFTDMKYLSKALPKYSYLFQNPPQNLNGSPVYPPQNLNGPPVYPPQNLYGPPVYPPQNLNGLPVYPSQNLNGPPINPPQNLNGPPVFTPQNLNGSPTNSHQNLNGPPVFTLQNLNGSSTNSHQNLNGSPTNSHQNLNGPPVFTPQNLDGPPVFTPQNLDGPPVFTPQNLNGSPANTPQNLNGQPVFKPSSTSNTSAYPEIPLIQNNNDIVIEEEEEEVDG